MAPKPLVDAAEALVAGSGFDAPTADEALRRVKVVAAASEPLGALLSTDPDAVALLAGDLGPASVAEVRAGALAAMDEGAGEPADALVTQQRRGLLRVAARDLLGVTDMAAATAELSDLAEGVLAAALDRVSGETGRRPRLAVIAMGKLGGRELNYVSDVDVLFVSDGDWQQATTVAERFLKLLAVMTPHGKAYEVDTNLRPEGRDGPLVRSLDAYRTYYERWAKTWEHQALLKARLVAGDRALATDFMELVAGYVWPDRWEPDAIAEIQRMKGVVESSRQVRRAGPREVKLGPGGLRDIEFAVQLLQLVHGRHDQRLRSANTLEALRALAGGGYVGDTDAELFADAYTFLRAVEHRIQLRRLRRSHVVPSDAAARERLARACGFSDIREAGALEQFDRELARTQAAVRRVHEKLFYRPLLERFAALGAADQLAGTDGGLDPAAVRERLDALGFADPERAVAHLEAMVSGVTRDAQQLRTLLPALLPVLADSPDPDDGLTGFRSLTERLAASPFFLRTLRDTPPVGELLAGVLGRSRLVGSWLERQPEVFGQLADLSGLDQWMRPADYRRLADGLLRRGGAEAETADALRRLKRRETARIAVRDLTGRASVTTVAAELTGVAEACLEAAAGLVNGGGDVRLAVIGMGKLGAGELSYASDLDVLVVFEPAAARMQALSDSERLMGLLSTITPEGQAFRIDANLRPEGKDGPLARTLDSYGAYYERWAEPWEFQALTQARPVAGDPNLGAAFIELIHSHTYPPVVPAGRLAAVRRMKARIERERAGARPARRAASGPSIRMADRVDLKLGAGGMSDVEWTVQMLQLRHGGASEALRRPGTLGALATAQDQGLLGTREAAWLADGWRLLAALRNALYLGGWRDPDLLPAAPADQAKLARLLGYDAPGGQVLTEDVGRAMRRIRRVHEKLFYSG